MELKHGLAAVFGATWMMRTGAFDAMCGLIAARLAAVGNLDEGTPERGLLWMSGGRSKQQKSVAVMGLYGMIDKRGSAMMDWMGGTSTDAFGAMFDQLMDDPNVKGIVIDSDTPGGNSVGVFELSKKIYDARGSKPIVAVSNSEMNSAGYYIGSSADGIVATPSAGTGSIGVWSAVASYARQLKGDGVDVAVWRSQGSPYKAEFLPWESFTKEAMTNEQVEVDRIYGEFRSSVARNRGVSEAVAQKNFGEGRVLDSKAALAAGLIDRIGSLEDVVSRMNSGKITVGTFRDKAAMAAAFEEELQPDESWRDVNATEAARLKLRRAGVLN